jgi:hypothetical protein
LFRPFSFLFARKWCKQAIINESKQARKQHLFHQEWLEKPCENGVENRQESTPRVRNKKHGERAMQGLKTAILLQQVAMYLRQPQKTACTTNRNLGKIIPK